MINFITEQEKPKTLTFADVEDNQFFVTVDGYLCQKAGKTRFTFIADSLGEPYSHWLSEVSPSLKIFKVLPTISKIEF